MLFRNYYNYDNIIIITDQVKNVWLFFFKKKKYIWVYAIINFIIRHYTYKYNNTNGLLMIMEARLSKASEQN